MSQRFEENQGIIPVPLVFPETERAYLNEVWRNALDGGDEAICERAAALLCAHLVEYPELTN